MYVWGVCVCEGQTPWVRPLPGEEAEGWRQASLHSYRHLSPQLFSCERLHLEATTGLVLPEDFLSFSLMTMCLFLGENLENTEEHKEEDGNHSSTPESGCGFICLYCPATTGTRWAGREVDVNATVTPGPWSLDPTVVRALEVPKLLPFTAAFFMVCKVPAVTGLT